MKTKTPFLLLIFLLCGIIVDAQNPFEDIGMESKPLTLSKGKYKEFFDNDSVVRIGNALFNVRTERIVGFMEHDTLYGEATLQPEVSSRWLSPDPKAAEFPGWSPYVFANGNPIFLIDPDGGKVTIHYIDSQNKKAKVVIGNADQLRAAMEHENNFVRYTSIFVNMGYYGGYEDVYTAVNIKKNINVFYVRGSAEFIEGKKRVTFDPGMSRPEISLGAALQLLSIAEKEQELRESGKTDDEIEEMKEHVRIHGMTGIVSEPDEILGHEFSHWLNRIREKRKYYARLNTKAGVMTNEEESNAISKENVYRSAKGKPIREHHKGAKGHEIRVDLGIDEGGKNK